MLPTVEDVFESLSGSGVKAMAAVDSVFHECIEATEFFSNPSLFSTPILVSSRGFLARLHRSN